MRMKKKRQRKRVKYIKYLATLEKAISMEWQGQKSSVKKKKEEKWRRNGDRQHVLTL